MFETVPTTAQVARVEGQSSGPSVTITRSLWLLVLNHPTCERKSFDARYVGVSSKLVRVHWTLSCDSDDSGVLLSDQGKDNVVERREDKDSRFLGHSCGYSESVTL